MIAWINFTVLVFSTLFFLYFYYLSVGPAALAGAPHCAGIGLG